MARKPAQEAKSRHSAVRGDTRSTRLALWSACIFTLVVYTLLPIGLIGGVGEETVAAFDYVGALEQLTGSTALTNFFVIVLVASFVISMNTATADGSRALYGIARDDMTVKQLYNLNRWNVPGRATSDTCSRTSSRSPGSSCCARTGRSGHVRSSCHRCGCRLRTCSR